MWRNLLSALIAVALASCVSINDTSVNGTSVETANNETPINSDWRRLNAVAELPAGASNGYIEAEHDARIHYKIWGDEGSRPLILLHGGLGASEDFGAQIAALAAVHRVIAIDSRGHGRSTMGNMPLSYHQISRDVVAVMDALNIDAATIAGWSDGGVVGLDMAIHFPQRVSGLFLLGTYYSVSGSRPSVAQDALIAAYLGHAEALYARISPTPDRYADFAAGVFAMWGKEPDYSEDQLQSISVPTVVAHGAYEEAIDENHARHMAELIPGAEFWLIDNASHFAMWQEKEAISTAILDFIKKVPSN